MLNNSRDLIYSDIPFLFMRENASPFHRRAKNADSDGQLSSRVCAVVQSHIELYKDKEMESEMNLSLVLNLTMKTCPKKTNSMAISWRLESV